MYMHDDDVSGNDTYLNDETDDESGDDADSRR